MSPCFGLPQAHGSQGLLVLFNVVTTKPKTGPDGTRPQRTSEHRQSVADPAPATGDRPDAPSDDLILDALDEEVAGEDKTTPSMFRRTGCWINGIPGAGPFLALL